MGQAAQRKKFTRTTFEHLERLGAAALAGEPEPADSAAWLQRNFVVGLLDAAKGGEKAWHNQVYLECLRHRQAAVRRGMTELMNNVFTAGLEPGRIVFSLLVDVQLPSPMVVGEFDDTEPLAQWTAQALGVPRHNLRLRHTAMFAPAHAGLFFILPSLQSLSRIKPPGEMPFVKTREPASSTSARQTLAFLVSVFTEQPLDLSRLELGDKAPKLTLPFWGPKSESPDHTATVSPLRAEYAFESLQLLGGFREALAATAAALEPWADRARVKSGVQKPVLRVTLRRGTDFRFQHGLDVLVKFEGIEMPEVVAYCGSFAEYFVPHLERLGVAIVRTNYAEDIAPATWGPPGGETGEAPAEQTLH